MKKQVCKLSFHRFVKEKLAGVASGVADGIFKNTTVFVSPPLTSTELTHFIEDYITAMNMYNANGKNYKTRYLDSKAKLMTALDTIAAYVNEVANGNTSIITLAGFETTSDIAHAAPQLEKILVITVKVTNVYGQVIIETPAIKDKGVTGYALILVSGTPLNVENFDDDTLDITASEGQKIIICLSKGKRKVVNGLNSNLTYYGYMYAINATGVSPLSDGIRVKCI